MAEELQSLLEKINQDGIMKAEAEKAKIIAEAEKSAAAIIAEAEKSAADIIAKAEKESMHPSRAQYPLKPISCRRRDNRQH